MEILQVNRKKTTRYVEKAKYKTGYTSWEKYKAVRIWGETVICIK